ncbi:Protein trichome birefringence-like 12 [Ranunculus cassubicifolius]
MASKKLSSTIFTWLILLTVLLLYLYSSILRFYSTSTPTSPSNPINQQQPHCNIFKGQWIQDHHHKPLYDGTCPFHRNSWNCIKNQRENMDKINSWKWIPENCSLPRINPFNFLQLMKDKSIGLVGDSLNENFLVSFLCMLRVADNGAKKWKKMGAWRGAYFPKFNVTVAYHRAVLLAKYEWQPAKDMNFSDHDERKGVYRVDVDIPADDWAVVTRFYDVLVFNTGHWWGSDKFPKEKPLVFYLKGRPILPPLGLSDGLRVVLQHMVSHIQKEVPHKTLKIWRMQSPRHFYGGEWNQNGSCLFNEPLEGGQLDTWFDPSNNGVNMEARRVNRLIEEAVQGTDIQLLDLTHLSEFRADAHPAIWLGKKDAVAIWGQDCMHWCLPGVPDTWVDILSALIHHKFVSD